MKDRKQKVHIIYCHPDMESTATLIKDSYLSALNDRNMAYTITDLYGEHFKSDFTKTEYKREIGETKSFLDNQVIKEQNLINDADSLTFIFPLFWADAPSKMLGYFSRVFTRGFRYGENDRMKKFSQIKLIITTRHSFNRLENTNQIEALKTLFDERFTEKTDKINMYFFTEVLDDDKRDSYAIKAYNIGFNDF